MKNKEVSRIRKKLRYFFFILINGVFRSKYIIKLYYYKIDVNCILYNYLNICNLLGIVRKFEVFILVFGKMKLRNYDE